MSTYKFITAKDKQHLAEIASNLIVENINSTLTNKSRFNLVLSGGSTPKAAYKLLGEQPLPWKKVDIFLGDERWVGPTDPSSNSLMIRNTLLSGSYGCNACFHPVPFTGFETPSDGARAFSDLIFKRCKGNPPIFDFVLLGLGDDGHTASLFPYTDSLLVDKSITTVSSGNGFERITLTAPILNSSTQIAFLVSGASKQVALKRLLNPDESFKRTPAKLVNISSPILILADEDAMQLL